MLCQIVIFRVVGALLSFILKQSLGLGYTINVINTIVYIILGSVIAIYYIKLVEKDKAKILHIILISVAMEFLVRVENDLGHVYGLPNMLNNMIYYVICLGWAIAILYAHRRIPKKKKKGISKNAYDQIVLSRECNALDKLSYCHASILGIICKNEEVRQDWEAYKKR